MHSHFQRAIEFGDFEGDRDPALGERFDTQFFILAYSF